MIILIPILLLLLTPIIMLAVRLARPNFAYHWLAAAAGALVVWPIVLLSRNSIPLNLPLVTWQPQILFRISPALLLDTVSWPYALALVTLALAVILTDVARAAETGWLGWSSSLLITGLGLLAVFAGNPLTLLLAWAAIDIVELVILLLHARHSAEQERIVVVFSARGAGIFMVMWAAIVARSTGTPLTFDTLTAQTSVYLLLAAGLRLGVIPLHIPFLAEPLLRRGLGTLLRMAPAAASLVLLARVAGAGLTAASYPYLLGFAGLAALSAALAWVWAKDDLLGRPFWVLGMAALSLGAAVRGQPLASLAWGLAVLLPGGLLFLASTKDRRLLPLFLLGWLTLTSLPFTPTLAGARLYSAPFSPILILFLVAHTLLLTGYLYHALQVGELLVGVERWVWVIYPLGLALLPAAHFIATGLGALPSLADAWPSVTVLALVGLLLFLDRRGFRIPSGWKPILRQTLSFDWIYRIGWGAFRLMGRWIGFINLILEGEGGILWTLLLLALLLSFLAQIRPGG